MFYIGCHLSTSGGYENMGKTALSIGANTFQYFTRNPQGGAKKIPPASDVEALLHLMRENGFGPLVAHAPYTYNPAAADDYKREFALRSMKEDIALLETMPGTLYNFHPGSHVGQGADAGIRLTAALLNEILPLCEHTVVLLETMAGKGSELGRNFEEISAMIDLVEPRWQSRVGVCLDTCHVSDGGYAIAEDPEGVLREFDRVIGLDRLKAVHLNDSKNPLGAHKDRHEKIGEGTLGLEGMKRIINHPAIRHLPFCLETPNELSGYAEEIALLRSLRTED